MMRKLIALLAVIPAVAFALPDIDVTVDWSQTRTTRLEAYEAGARTYLVTVQNEGVAVDLGDYTPSMWWATSNTATSISTATVSIVNATAGTFRATFSAAALNYTGGRYIYGVGLTSGSYSTARIGTFIINSDPYASGASPVVWTTNINWALYNYENTAVSGPYRAGAGITASTNADGSVSFAASSGGASAVTQEVHTAQIAGLYATQIVQQASIEANATAAEAANTTNGLQQTEIDALNAISNRIPDAGTYAGNLARWDGSSWVPVTGVFWHEPSERLYIGPTNSTDYSYLQGGDQSVSFRLGESKEFAFWTGAVGFTNMVDSGTDSSNTQVIVSSKFVQDVVAEKDHNTWTNGTTGWFDGRLLETNGVYFTIGGTNKWLL